MSAGGDLPYDRHEHVFTPHNPRCSSLKPINSCISCLPCTSAAALTPTLCNNPKAVSLRRVSLNLLTSSSHSVLLFTPPHLQHRDLESLLKRGSGPPQSPATIPTIRGTVSQPQRDPPAAPWPPPARAGWLSPLHEERELLLEHLMGGLDITGTVGHQVLRAQAGEGRESSHPCASAGQSAVGWSQLHAHKGQQNGNDPISSSHPTPISGSRCPQGCWDGAHPV